MNHLAHNFVSVVEEKKNLKELLISKGYDPRAVATLSDDELVTFAQKVMPELYKGAHNPTFETADIGNDEGETLGKSLTYKNGDVNFEFTGKILFSKSTFSSYLKLASTMGHELSHACDYFNGNMKMWYDNGGNIYRKYMSELKAYQWENDNGGISNNLRINWYTNQINSNKFLKPEPW